ncbi:hypothetical protein FRC02_010788 [Tulasnella sp. 418]|nr:hypothetical protein FRC02_010788 [Tulasnella sp. 418]
MIDEGSDDARSNIILNLMFAVWFYPVENHCKFLLCATMVSDAKSNGPLEPGIYIIKCVAAKGSLNIIRPSEGEESIVCHWKTTKSPSERWLIEQGELGYRFRNASTHTYISTRKDKPDDHDRLLGLSHAMEWIIEEKEVGIYHIKLVTHPTFVFDLLAPFMVDGSKVMVCTDYHGNTNQQWTFQKIVDDQPSLLTKQIFVGPVPPGLYWLGHPYITINAGESAPMGALGVATRFPPKDDYKAFAYLMPIEEHPLLHQVWVVECARHGYRLKSAAIDSYLNYYRREAIVESNLPDWQSASEWTLSKKEVDKQDKVSWRIHTCTDEDVIVGVNTHNPVNKLHAKFSRNWTELEGNTYLNWRFEPVEEKWIDFSSDIAAVAKQLQQPCI